MPNIEEKLDSIIQGQLGFIDEVKEKLNTVTNAYPYQIKHDPEIRLTLEQEYEEIAENNPEIVGLSYVGIRTFLNPSDTIDVQIGQGTYSRIFINGEEYSATYTYTGENMEIATVFYFSNADGTLNLANTMIDADEVLIVDYSNKANVPTSITNYARIVYIDSTACSYPSNCKHLKINKWRTLPSNYPYLVELTMNSNPPSISLLNNGTMPKLIIQSETLCLSNDEGGGNVINFYNSSSVNSEVITPNLIDVSGKGICGVIYYVGRYTFPPTIKNVGVRSFYVVKNHLNISNAYKATFDNGWYASTAPTELVCTATDWMTDINLAGCGAKQSKDWFVDFFGRLHDYDDNNTHMVKIPSAIYTSLTAEEKAIATDKGWTVQGA